MSIWGKFGGAAAGMVVGGPIGALVGVLAGHFLLDRESTPGDSNVVFTIALIALSAKMAKADGIVTPDEIEAFNRIFRVAPEEAANVRRVFDLARRDTAGYETYAGQIARLFVGNPAMLEDILDG
jgi:DnaJ like chaperone protein